MRADTRAIADLGSMIRYFQRGRHQLLFEVSPAGDFFKYLKPENHALVPSFVAIRGFLDRP